MTVSVGHCHPDVVSAVNAQNQLLQHTTTIYLNNQIAEYAKELADRMPGNLKVHEGACCGAVRGCGVVWAGRGGRCGTAAKPLSVREISSAAACAHLAPRLPMCRLPRWCTL